MKIRYLSLAVLLFSASRCVLAHTGHGAHVHNESAFLAGLTHPFSGLDHLLAMLAVGLWAAQTRGRAVWALPAAFLSVMALGGALGMNGVELPLVEAGILASVFVLGLALIFAMKAPLYASLPLVALCALFHGHAHGAEAAGNSSLAYGAGFLFATAFLHAAGWALGLGLCGERKAYVLRAAGAGVAVVAVILALV